MIEVSVSITVAGAGAAAGGPWTVTVVAAGVTAGTIVSVTVTTDWRELPAPATTVWVTVMTVRAGFCEALQLLIIWVTVKMV